MGVDLKAQNKIQGQSQLNHINHGGRPKTAPILTIFSLTLALEFILGFEIYPSVKVSIRFYE